MRKIVLLLLLGCTLSIGSFATNKPGRSMSKKKISQKTTDGKPGRECCTKTIGIPGRGTWSATACSGWLFSNSATAQAKACQKAQDKLLQFFTQPLGFSIELSDVDGFTYELSHL